MENEMIERVGKAMLDAHGQWEIENNRLGGQLIWTTPHLELLARTAIDAMREPTEAMIDAGWAAGCCPHEGEKPGPIFTAMLAAALTP